MKIKTGLTFVSSAAALLIGTHAYAQSENTATGTHALYSLTTGTANTAMGFYALPKLKSSNYNSAFGRGALYNNVYSSNNTAVGYLALYSFTGGSGGGQGDSNTAVGAYALGNLTEGAGSVAIGNNALGSAITTGGSVAIGQWALSLMTNASYNVAVGQGAMWFTTTGNANTALGQEAMESNTTGQNNVAIGPFSLSEVVTGSDNTALGYAAGPTGPGMNNTIVIGSGASVGFPNYVRIGNSSNTVIGGYGPWSNISDARFKKNVKEEVPGLAFITKLRPVTFYWDMEKLRSFEKGGARVDDGSKAKQKYTGFLAQEVEAAAQKCNFDFSGIIKPPDEKVSTYQLSYADFVVPLVKSVQEQQKEIEALKAAIAALPTAPAGSSPWRELFGSVLAAFVGAGLALAYTRRTPRKSRAARPGATALAHE